jgi:poly(3-hydroxyalkanoate) depolymerase
LKVCGLKRSEAPQFSEQTIDGRRVRVARWTADSGTQNRRPLLFFNGIGANIELMAPLADHLAARDIVTFDMPGIGGSPRPTVPYRAWMMARIADRLMSDFGYGDIDVMGVSWGGAMAQQFALQYPRRVHRLVLAATSAGMLMVPGKISSLAKMADPRRYIDPEFMRENFARLYGGDEDGSEGHVGRIVSPTKRGYLYQLMAMLGWTSAPFLPFLRVPTLILMGDDDQVVPLVNGRILEALIPDARLVVVKGGGHLFLVSRAQQVVPEIEAFLSERPAKPRQAA